jgi:hypothetical protein
LQNSLDVESSQSVDTIFNKGGDAVFSFPSGFLDGNDPVFANAYLESVELASFDDSSLSSQHTHDSRKLERITKGVLCPKAASIVAWSNS